MSQAAISEEMLKSVPVSKQSYIRSLMATHPDVAAREVASMLAAKQSKEKKPQVFLDENVMFLNYPFDDAFPLKVVERLKFYGVEASFVGDTREFEGLERRMWVRSPSEQNIYRIMTECDKRVNTGRYHDIDLRTEAQTSKAFKSCINEHSAVVSGDRIAGVHQVPPKESSDVNIGKWADENGILVLSFDADPGLEGKQTGDRIRLDQSQIECNTGKVQAGRRQCDSQDVEADRLARLVVWRMRKVKELLRGQF